MVSPKGEKEDPIKDLPLIETLIASFRYAPNNLTVKLLCCNALICCAKFGATPFFLVSSLDFCWEKAKTYGLIESVANDISAETDKQLLVMELAILAAYGVNGVSKSLFLMNQSHSRKTSRQMPS